MIDILFGLAIFGLAIFAGAVVVIASWLDGYLFACMFLMLCAVLVSGAFAIIAGGLSAVWLFVCTVPLIIIWAPAFTRRLRGLPW